MLRTNTGFCFLCFCVFFEGFKVSKSVCLAGCGCVYRTETCDQNFKAVILRVRRCGYLCWFPEEQAGHRRLCQMSPMSRGPEHCWARPPQFVGPLEGERTHSPRTAFPNYVKSTFARQVLQASVVRRGQASSC